MRARTTLLPAPQETSAPANPSAPSCFQLSTFDCLSVSPLFATLTRPITSNPFICHSYTKPPGWGCLAHSSFRACHPEPIEGSVAFSRLSFSPSSEGSLATRHFLNLAYPRSFDTLANSCLPRAAAKGALFSSYPLSFDTLANSCAAHKTLSPVFSIKSELLPQNTRGGWLPVVDCQLSTVNSLSAAHFCTFLHSPKRYAICFQTLPSSLHKTPGRWGGTARANKKSEVRA
jgi:hypothetical protein